MDANYVINRLKTSLYKYPTAALLKIRLGNLEARHRMEIISTLKHEMHRHRNADIHEPLFEMLYRP